jgi:excisionase family DNA binding protein
MSNLLSPEDAAKRAGVSRRTVLRAVKRQDVQAVRDNRGRWRVDGDSLDAWAALKASSGQRPVSAQSVVQLDAERLAAIRELGELRAELVGRAAELEGVRERLRAVEVDRDAWRDLARRSWWQRLFGGFSGVL